jgi:hypothetical protein
MIYFILSGKRVKIGTTTNLDKRLKSLSTGNPIKLQVVAIMDGSYQTEKGIHDLFARYRREGEWFKFCEELKFFIRAIRKYPNENNIITLFKESIKLRLKEKALRQKRGVMQNYLIGSEN